MGDIIVPEVNSSNISVESSISQIVTGDISSASTAIGWTDITAEYFKFSTSPSLNAGNIMQWFNGADFSLGLTFDGILQLKRQSSLPASLTGGLLFYDNNLYLGQD